MRVAPSLNKIHYTLQKPIPKNKNVNSAGSEATQEAEIMKDVNQSHMETDTPSVKLIMQKTKKRVDYWNVRILYQAGYRQQVLREMENYSIELPGTLNRTLSTEHTVLYSG